MPPSAPPTEPRPPEQNPLQPLDVRCASLRASNEERLREAGLYDDATLRTLEPCLMESGATWGLSFVEPLGNADSAEPQEPWLSVVVARKGSGGGAPIVACVRPNVVGPVDCKPGRVNPEPIGDGNVVLGMLFDFDGDGASEILLSRTFDGPNQVYTWAEIWTVRDGRLALYPPTLGVPVVALKDIDQDGRPDLVTRGSVEYCAVYDPCGDPENKAYDRCSGFDAPLHWRRSLPSGRFAPPAPIPASEADQVHEGTSPGSHPTWGIPAPVKLR